MRLAKFNYSEFANEDRAWKLDGLELGTSNLLVGKNATGKSRTLNVISGLSKLLSGKLKQTFISGAYDAWFENSIGKNNFLLEFENYRVIRENYHVAGVQKLHRGRGGIGRIHAADVEGKSIELKFQSPDDQLSTVAKRDSLQHPFLEDLFQWGRSVRHFEFGKRLGHDNLVVVVPGTKQQGDRDADDVAAILHDGLARFKPDFSGTIIRDMEEIGYDIESVELLKPIDIRPELIVPGDLKGVAVKEKGLKCFTHQVHMSQGMFRALAIIIHLNFAILAEQTACFLIDDIGEGLDFERSCALIDLLRNKARGKPIQLIMSTNDRFIMNNVPLEEWSLLHRENQVVKVFNYNNSKELFERFKITGLSNFDLLTTDFIEKSRHQ